jgi:hypothetical protein
MGKKLTRSQLVKLLADALRQAEGCGHSLHFGDPPRQRYCPDTGRPYFTEPTLARLECPASKMQAIWSVWEQAEMLLIELSTTPDGKEVRS